MTRPNFPEKSENTKFSRKFGLLAGVVALLGGCAGPGGPNPALTYRVSVAESRKVALVAPSAPLATIADLEAAARIETGCRATAIPRIYDAAGQDRDRILPAAAYTGFGGQAPVTLACR